MIQSFLLLPKGETKAEDSSNKEAAEEKQEEGGDYHRSDEQVGPFLALSVKMSATFFAFPPSSFLYFSGFLSLCDSQCT